MLRLLLVDVRDQTDGRLHHLHSVAAKETALKVNELTPKAHIGVNDRALALAVFVGLFQRHALILHQVGYAYTGRAAHACHTVHQGPTPRTCHLHKKCICI